MKRINCRFVVFVLMLMNLASSAQSLTGSWEGVMGSELLQLNIEQKKGRICGYTHDHGINDTASNCSAKFSGSYLPQERVWYLQGNEFFYNSGNHTLMNIKIWFNPGDPKGVLRASIADNDVSLAWHETFARFYIVLTKKKNKPIPYPGQPNSCFDKVTPAPKPKEPKKTVVDTIPKPLKVMPKVADSSIFKIKNMEGRAKSEQSRLVIHAKEINLKLFDNGVVDNDIISVFYNGKLLVSNQRLSEKAIELNILLDEKVKIHEITLFAENLGEIPPNTALIIVTAGKQRFELRSKASLEENAVLVFEYLPIP